MESLISAFERRAESGYNQALLHNVGVVIAAHYNDELELEGSEEVDASRLRDMYSGKTSEDVKIDRDAIELTHYHNVAVRQVIDFADGGRVVDVGAGRSDFLDVVGRSSETIAVDLRTDNLAHQAARGHTPMHALAVNLDALEDDSVRLLHAAYSAPYWSVGPLDARQTAEEYTRVLEPGGIAMIGSVAYSKHHIEYEKIVARTKWGKKAKLPYLSQDDEYQSHVRTAFVEEVLEMEAEGTLTVVANRFDNANKQLKRNKPQNHVPNFLMIRRTGS